MRRGNTLRTISLVTLLLPGLVLAAPMAGSCGLCDRGAPCPNMTAPAPAVANHSCCGEAVVEAPTRFAPSSLGSTACDCGSDAMPAIITTVEAPTMEADHAEASVGAVVSAALGFQTATRARDRDSTTPPSPLIFLIDCVFLT
jgi:hypothetical protein